MSKPFAGSQGPTLKVMLNNQTSCLEIHFNKGYHNSAVLLNFCDVSCKS